MLDVSYVVDFPAGEIPNLVNTLRPDVGLEALESFSTMRVPWLEVSCSDGLQVSLELQAEDLHTRQHSSCASCSDHALTCCAEDSSCCIT